ARPTITNYTTLLRSNNDSYGVNKNSSLTVSAPGVLSNDVDLDGNSMSAVLVATTTHGTLNLSTNGGFTYMPSSNYFGADSFTYRVNDGVTNSGVATVSLTVTNVIRAPVANNDSYGVNKNGSLTVNGPGVLSNDVDLDGNPMSAVVVATTTHGTLNLRTNNRLTHTTSTNYPYTNSFRYRVNDGVTNSGVATVSLTVTNVIRAPVANNDSYGVNKNGSLTVSGPGVLGNDVDPDGN